MTFKSTHKEALAAAQEAWFDNPIGDENIDMDAAIRAYIEARGAKIVPAKPSVAWSEKYCDLTNRHPDGTQSTSSHDGWIFTTFREMAGREIAAVLSASPDPFTDEASA